MNKNLCNNFAQMKTELYDVIIIGGGPIGLACGLEAKKHCLSYCILEKGTLVNSLYNYPMNMTFLVPVSGLKLAEYLL